MMNVYTNQYKENQVATASREQILLMLYDGAIRFIHRAIKGQRENNLGDKLSGISKCLAIVTELSNSLDHSIGGDIAADLDGLYHFMIRELNKGRKDTEGIEHLENVERLLVDLRETWAQAIDINKKQLSGSADTSTNKGYRSLATAG